MASAEAAPRLITIREFTQGMLGFKDRGYYYEHEHDPGFPQRVKVFNKPMLVRDECNRFVNDIIAARDAPKKKGG